MFGRVATLHFALAMLAAASASNAGVLCAPRTVDGAPVTPANYSAIDLHTAQPGQANTAAHDRATVDVPSAPLPPALWPGLALLLVLGSARFAFRARRRGVRG